VACGGDIVGNWTVSTLCGPGANQTQSVSGCPGGMATIHVTATGTLRFGVDGSYTTMLTPAGSAMDFLPKSCLGGSTCAMLQDALLQQGTFSDGTCTDDGTNCNCALTLAARLTTQTGTYSVSGTTLTTTTADAGMPSLSPYCVSGNQLSIASSDPTQPMLVFVATK
jgi:hypothetical protein